MPSPFSVMDVLPGRFSGFNSKKGLRSENNEPVNNSFRAGMPSSWVAAEDVRVLSRKRCGSFKELSTSLVFVFLAAPK